MNLIAEGDTKLILAYRPFEHAQPYAETGPIFLHAADWERYEAEALSAWFSHLAPALVRGYDAKDLIAYETGRVVPGHDLAAACRAFSPARA